MSSVAHPLKRLGVLGGTFDPPHKGHLALAGAALDQLELDRVLFVPAGHPPHRPTEPLSDALHREAMVSLAIEGREGFALSRADIDRPGPHYTVDLLAILASAHPQAELYFLMGGDSLSQFLTWRNPARIIELARLVVLRRLGWRADLVRLKESLPQIEQRLVWLDYPAVELSATEIRRHIRERLSITGMVPQAVEEYVHYHTLYLTD